MVRAQRAAIGMRGCQEWHGAHLLQPQLIKRVASAIAHLSIRISALLLDEQNEVLDQCVSSGNSSPYTDTPHRSTHMRLNAARCGDARGRAAQVARHRLLGVTTWTCWRGDVGCDGVVTWSSWNGELVLEW